MDGFCVACVCCVRVLLNHNSCLLGHSHCCTMRAHLIPRRCFPSPRALPLSVDLCPLCSHLLQSLAPTIRIRNAHCPHAHLIDHTRTPAVLPSTLSVVKHLR